MRNAIFILVFLIGQTAFAHHEPGKSTRTLTGKVNEAGTTETLSGVKVSIKGTSLFTFTDKEGNFILDNLPEGNFEIEFSLVSFSTEKLQLDPLEISDNKIDVSLNPR